MNSFEYVTSKLGNVDAETRSIAKELYDVAKANGHEIWFMWGMGSSAEHRTGNALDLMVRNKKAGEFLRNYVWIHRKRLRLIHVIWDRSITSTRVQPGVRRRMADRGNPTQNHEDHPHVWFAPGPYVPPPSSTPKPVAKPAAPARKSNTQIAAEVWAGKWGNGDDRMKRLKAAGYDAKAIQSLVSRGVGRHAAPAKPAPRKSLNTLATEVIQGKWGNGKDRERRLKAAGYSYVQVQAEVNKRL